MDELELYTWTNASNGTHGTTAGHSVEEATNSAVRSHGGRIVAEDLEVHPLVESDYTDLSQSEGYNLIF